jgi:hypothetical protein
MGDPVQNFHVFRGNHITNMAHVTLQCIVVSALKKTSKVNTILKVVIFKHSKFQLILAE